MDHFIWFLCLVCVIFVRSDVNAEKTHRRSRRNSLQFSDMIAHTTKRNPFDFIDYGCYCGLGGGGKPVDKLDLCCKRHDNCWEKAEDNWCFSGIFTTYQYKINRKGKIVCKDERGTCARTYCKCDAVAARCFARRPYIEEHFDYDQDLC